MTVLKQTEDEDDPAVANAKQQAQAAKPQPVAQPNVPSQMPSRARQVLNVAGRGLGAVGRGVAAYGRDLASAKPVDRQRLKQTTARQAIQENLSPKEYQELQQSQADFRGRKYGGDVNRKILPSSKQTRRLGRAANQTFKDFTGLNIGEGARRLKRRFSGDSFMDALRNNPSKRNVTRTRQRKEDLARFSQPQFMPRDQDGDDAFSGTSSGNFTSPAAYEPFKTYEQRLAGMYGKEPAPASPEPASTVMDPYYQQQMSPQAGFGPDLPVLDETGNPKSTAPLTDDGEVNPDFKEEQQAALDENQTTLGDFPSASKDVLRNQTGTLSDFGMTLTEGSEESPAARAAREAKQKRAKTKQTKLGRDVKGQFLPGYGGKKNVAAVTNLERTKNVRQDLADKRKRQQESMSGEQGTLDV